MIACSDDCPKGKLNLKNRDNSIKVDSENLKKLIINLDSSHNSHT